MATSTINKLFAWKTDTTINGQKFYIRIVGDSIVSAARSHALAEARLMRRKLRDTSTEEYLANIDLIHDFTPEELSQYIVNMRMRTVMQEYLDRVPRPQLEPLADNPTQEQQEEYEAAKQEREDNYIKDMELYVQSWEEDFRKLLGTQPEESKLKEAEKLRTDQVAEEVFRRAFETYILAHAIYEDPNYTKRVFQNHTEYAELPSTVQQQFSAAYNSMTLTPDELKN